LQKQQHSRGNFSGGALGSFILVKDANIIYLQKKNLFKLRLIGITFC